MQYSLMLANGEIRDESGQPSWIRPDRPLLLSRSLCRYRRYSAPSELPEQHLARAIMLDAQVHAPVAAADFLALKDPGGAEIWYWDASITSRLERGAGARSTPRPESVFFEDADGWRILAVSEGFEAQCIEDGILLASVWRRDPFTPREWAGFVLGVDRATCEAPDLPPPVVQPGMVRNPLRLRRKVRPPLAWRDVERGGLALALVFATVASGLAAVGGRHEFDRHKLEANLANLEAVRSKDAALKTVRAQQAMIAAYSEASDNAPAISTAARTLLLLEENRYRVKSWSVDQSSFMAAVEPEQNAVAVRDVAAKMEADPVLRDVSPTFLGASRGIVFEAKLEGAEARRTKIR